MMHNTTKQITLAPIISFIAAFALASVLLLGALHITVYGDATPAALDLDHIGSVSIELVEEDTGKTMKNGTLSLYKVADLVLDDGNMAYVLTDDFAGCTVKLDNPSDADTASAVADYAKNHQLVGTASNISSSGSVFFKDLGVGLYLIVQTSSTDGFYDINPFLVTMPMDEDGEWLYDIDASPKVEVVSSPEEPETKEEEKEEIKEETKKEETKEEETAEEDGEVETGGTGDMTNFIAPAVILLTGFGILVLGLHTKKEES